MRKSIVSKLFIMITGLSFLIIGSIFAVQHFFFEHFYINQKTNDIYRALQVYQERGLLEAESAQQAFQNEVQFYQENDAWIAVLDENGYLKYTEDYFIEVQVNQSEIVEILGQDTITLPLYTILDIERTVSANLIFPYFLESPGKDIAIEGIVMDGVLFPQRVASDVSSLRDESRLENEQLIHKEYEMLPHFNSPTEYFEENTSVLMTGTLTDIQISQEHFSRYTNSILLNQIKAFQADLLYGDVEHWLNDPISYVINNIEHSILIEKIELGNEPAYVVSLASLQPVGEATNVMQTYFGYIAIGAVVLAIIASLYLSRKIASPLIRMEKMTQQMAKLKFSESIPIESNDEIGNLGKNINNLSTMLESHIFKLEQEIEKEKKLETTRKEFISGISHELKTPLSVLESCLYILKDKPNSEKKDYYFKAMEDEVKNMNFLVKDMLELAKYDANAYNLEMRPFRLDEVIEHVYSKQEKELSNKKLHVFKSLHEVTVMGNKNRISQVVLNFLTNAVRYTPERNEIILLIKENGNQVEVLIENKGVHIPEEQLDKIWDRFYRGDQSRDRSTGGMGLGLAISKKILEWHQAPYGVRNTEEGVLFWFKLNIAEKEV
ncbi:sensor histidine kinase [Amphibacillus cookii]|uniref:sensor histidine kinase n=1 Tax=Amphibacillus cookii TaxID=767787 RepID=UPI00195B47C1|nr:HAMP domain-containing sensor histidine kinase [Amphibacillus cookii]MBM7542238.1 signal transduction histidine kinase [Amphibacillus cookii]